VSRFLRQPEPAAPTTVARRQSVYEDRFNDPAAEGPWMRIAEPNPWTGELEWEPDWARRVKGWMPLEEFQRER
jgi:hypothetical protein